MNEMTLSIFTLKRDVLGRWGQLKLSPWASEVVPQLRLSLSLDLL